MGRPRKGDVAMPPLLELRPGSILGGYQIQAVVARGGMGAVYKALELSNGRLVALKIVLPELAADASFRERFERESQIATSLEHPHIVPVYATGEAEGVLYMAMRFVHGVDLRQLISLSAPLAPGRVVKLVEQIASGLDAAHRRGLVHRDVKPANVMVEDLGDHDHCYVMDFGLAKQAGSTGLTKTGSWVGTLDYVAPEQILGRSVDARTDVYSLGALLYYALTREPPFPAGHDAAKLHAHLNSPPPGVTRVRPDLSTRFDEVVARALAKHPADRYPSAGDLASAARAALRGGVSAAPERSVATGEAAALAAPRRNIPLSATPAVTGDETGTAHVPHKAAKPARGRLFVATGALLAVAAIVGGALLLAPSGSPPRSPGLFAQSANHRPVAARI